jgi:hypothetical protein
MTTTTQVIPPGWQVTSVAVGTGQAALVGADGVVRDDSWIEVFQREMGLIAIVQASGPDYPEVLARALGYPVADDQEGDVLKVLSGKLAIFSAAVDGTGPYSDRLVSARPGLVPPVHGPPSRQDHWGLMIQSPNTEYELKVRWYTQIDENNCFARWLLIPVQDNE